MTDPLFENILAQPGALAKVAEHQFGPGREALLRSAELLRNSKRIVISGMGASLFASIPLSYALGGHGVEVSVIETSELLYFLPSTIDRGTAVILVSRSGESVEVTKSIALLKDRSSCIIAVVNVQRSTLATQATETISVGSPPDQLVAIQTYTGTLVALALLGAAYQNELDSARDELETTVATVERMLGECLRAEWHDFIDVGSPLYLLGRGASLASVHAGALLMHEVAKMPGVAMSSAQFRHGPVEVVSEDFRAIVLGSQETTAALDLALAQDLTRIGGNIRWVGPLGPTSEVIPLCPWPEKVPSRFCSLPEMIPLQLLAYRTAQAKGVASGGFRFAPAVPLSETGFLNTL